MAVDKSAWDLEEDDQPEAESKSKLTPMTQLEIKPKARLVLEDSDSENWGLVLDCHGALNTIPEDAEPVGKWNRYQDDVIWISLTTPIEALADRAIQQYVFVSEARRKAEAAGTAKKTGTKKARKASAAKPKTEQGVEPTAAQETANKLDSLRKKLRGG